jgi:hypothetical protein
MDPQRMDLAAEKSPEERAAPSVINGSSRRSPRANVKSGYVGPNQPWAAQRCLNWKTIAARSSNRICGYRTQRPRRSIAGDSKISGLPDEELFITFKADLNRLRGKKMLHIVGENDKGHWIEGGEKGLEFRREVYAFKRFAPYADALRLIVVPNLTHYGHVENYNERLANLMVTAFRDYFQP